MPVQTDPPYSPEGAGIPRVNFLARNNTTPPSVIGKAAGVAITIYDENTDPKCESIFVHNLATGALAYAKNMDAAADQYHDIIAGGDSERDGRGTKCEFFIRRDGIRKLSLISLSGAMIASIEKIELPFGSGIQNAGGK